MQIATTLSSRSLTSSFPRALGRRGMHHLDFKLALGTPRSSVLSTVNPGTGRPRATAPGKSKALHPCRGSGRPELRCLEPPSCFQAMLHLKGAGGQRVWDAFSTSNPKPEERPGTALRAVHAPIGASGGGAHVGESTARRPARGTGALPKPGHCLSSVAT